MDINKLEKIASLMIVLRTEFDYDFAFRREGRWDGNLQNGKFWYFIDVEKFDYPDEVINDLNKKILQEKSCKKLKELLEEGKGNI